MPRLIDADALKTWTVEKFMEKSNSGNFFTLPSDVTEIVEKIEEMPTQSCKCDELTKEAINLAQESVKRELALGKLEAECEVWAKAANEGRLAILPIPIKGIDCIIRVCEVCTRKCEHSAVSWHDT